jgi:hypothetical protein
MNGTLIPDQSVLPVTTPIFTPPGSQDTQTGQGAPVADVSSGQGGDSNGISFTSNSNATVTKTLYNVPAGKTFVISSVTIKVSGVQGTGVNLNFNLKDAGVQFATFLVNTDGEYDFTGPYPAAAGDVITLVIPGITPTANVAVSATISGTLQTPAGSAASAQLSQIINQSIG